MAEPLRIRFAADVDAAKQGMASLAASVASNALQIGSALKAVNDNAQRMSTVMAAIPTVAAGLAGAVAGYIAIKTVWDLVGRAADQARERLDAVMKVATGAQSAGVGTSFFQRWIAEAQSLNLEVSKLEGMLQKARSAMTDRIGEGDRGSSSGARDRIQQNVLAGNLGRDALTRYNAVDGQEAKIRVVLDLLDELKAKGANLAAFDLAGKVFGEDFEGKLRAGIDMIGQMRRALDAVGATGANGARILSPQEIEAADRLKRTLEEVQKIMGEAMAPMQRDLAMYQAQQAQSAAEFYRTLADGVATVAKLYDWFAKIGSTLEQLGNSSFWKRISDVSDRLGLSSYGGMELVDPKTGKAVLGAAGGVGAGAGGSGSVGIRAPGPGDTSRSLPSLHKKDTPASEETDAVETYIQSLQRSTAALKAEVEAYGKSNEEKQKAIALAKAEEIAKQRGSALTDEERQKIESLGAAAGAARDRMAALQQQSQQAAEAMRSFGQAGVDALYDMIVEGKSASDVMNNLAKMILKAALQSALMGTGPLAGLMGTAAPAGATGAASVGGLFGMLASLLSGRAGGGSVTSGQPYIIGENGPEIMVPGMSGTVIPNHALRAPSIAAPSVPAGAAAPVINASMNIRNEAGHLVKAEGSTRSDGRGGLSMDVMVRQVGAGLAKDMSNKRGSLRRAVLSTSQGGYGENMG